MSEMAIMHGFGGGVSGGTLAVTAPPGVAVSVSNGGKVKTKISNDSGVAVFKGLQSGEWAVVITDGINTAQKKITINVDFEIVIAFFSATINVTYPAGSSCAATDGTTTLTAPDSSGTWGCIVPNAGTWTFKCDNETETSSKVVSITEDGQTESVSLEYSYILVDNTE